MWGFLLEQFGTIVYVESKRGEEGQREEMSLSVVVLLFGVGMHSRWLGVGGFGTCLLRTQGRSG